MPGPKMGPRPPDFDEVVIRQSPTMHKWYALAPGQRLKYACREFIKGEKDEEERLMRRIMIARRNNLRDHEALKKARRVQKRLTTAEERRRKSAAILADNVVELEMDVAAVEATRSYRRWMDLPEGGEFVYNQRYIKGREGHDWLLKKNIWRRMRYRRENKKMVEKLKEVEPQPMAVQHGNHSNLHLRVKYAAGESDASFAVYPDQGPHDLDAMDHRHPRLQHDAQHAMLGPEPSHGHHDQHHHTRDYAVEAGSEAAVAAAAAAAADHYADQAAIEAAVAAAVNFEKSDTGHGNGENVDAHGLPHIPVNVNDGDVVGHVDANGDDVLYGQTALHHDPNEHQRFGQQYHNHHQHHTGDHVDEHNDTTTALLQVHDPLQAAAAQAALDAAARLAAVTNTGSLDEQQHGDGHLSHAEGDDVEEDAEDVAERLLLSEVVGPGTDV